MGDLKERSDEEGSITTSALEQVQRQTTAVQTKVKVVAEQVTSRRRDFHSAAPPSPFSGRFNRDDEGVLAK